MVRKLVYFKLWVTCVLQLVYRVHYGQKVRPPTSRKAPLQGQKGLVP
jgi:hypothetical protein